MDSKTIWIMQIFQGVQSSEGLKLQNLGFKIEIILHKNHFQITDQFTTRHSIISPPFL